MVLGIVTVVLGDTSASLAGLLHLQSVHVARALASRKVSACRRVLQLPSAASHVGKVLRLTDY
jgi:hypothetical protein